MIFCFLINLKDETNMFLFSNTNADAAKTLKFLSGLQKVPPVLRGSSDVGEPAYVIQEDISRDLFSRVSLASHNRS